MVVNDTTQSTVEVVMKPATDNQGNNSKDFWLVNSNIAAVVASISSVVIVVVVIAVMWKYLKKSSGRNNGSRWSDHFKSRSSTTPHIAAELDGLRAPYKRNLDIYNNVYEEVDGDSITGAHNLTDSNNNGNKSRKQSNASPQESIRKLLLKDDADPCMLDSKEDQISLSFTDEVRTETNLESDKNAAVIGQKPNAYNPQQANGSSYTTASAINGGSFVINYNIV